MYIQDMSYEDIVKRDNGKMGRVIFPLVVGIALAIFIFFFNYLMLYVGNFIFFTGWISLGICLFVYYRFKAFNNTEFEIELLNEYFSVSKVMRQKKRIELAEFSLKECEYIGPTTSDKFNEFLSSADFTLNITEDRKYEVKDDIWFCAVKGNGYKYNVVFHFKNPMYKFFRRFNPRNVFIMPMPKEEPEEASEELSTEGDEA